MSLVPPQVSTEEQFVHRLRTLYEVESELAKVQDHDTLCRLSIELGVSRLGFERLSLWLLTPDQNALTGTFGIDEEGHLRDERSLCVQGSYESFTKPFVQEEQMVVYSEQSPIHDADSRVVGYGATASSALRDGDRIIGLLFTDNFLCKRPITELKRELLVLYATALGRLHARNQALKALAASEARLRTIVENEPACVKILNAEGVLLEMNQAGLNMIEASPNQALGQTVFNLFQGEHKDRFEEMHQRVIEGQPGTLQYKMLGLKGTERWMETHAVPLRTPDGEVQHLAVSYDITERRKTELALQEREAQLRSLGDNLPNGLIYRIVLEHDGTRRFEYISAGVEHLHGVAQEEVLANPNLIYDQILPEDRLRLNEAEQESFENLSVIKLELRMRVASGEIRWFLTSAAPHKLPDGRLAWDGIEVDITDSKKAEDLLKESEYRYKLLADNTEDLVSLNDIQRHHNYMSPAVERLTGYTIAELKSSDYSSRVHPEDLALVEKTRLANVAGEKTRIQYRYLHKNGGVLWLDLQATPILDENGNVEKILCCSRDITASKQMEASLRESEERFRHAFDFISVGMVLSTLDRKFLRINQAFCKMLGYEESELLGKGFQDITHPDDIETSQDHLAAVSRGEMDSFQMEKRYLHRDGSAVWAWMTYTQIRGEDGKPAYNVVQIQDITERKRMEEALKKSENELRQAQKMDAVGTLAGGVAHDFNNILAVVLLSCELCRQDKFDPDLLAKHLESIELASRRGRELVKQILAFSRKTEPQREVMQLQPVIKDALKLLRASLPAMIEIQEEIQDDAPPCKADATQIRQVIMNLGINAAHAMTATHGTLTVGLQAITSSELMGGPKTALPPGNYLRLTVKDTGHGMDSETRERAFEPFYTTKPSGEGTGLGLSVVHGIVKSHEGEIHVYSEPNKGTLFTIYLPAAQLQPTGENAQKSPEQVGNGENVLLVDDEEALVFLASRMLTKLGYEVFGFVDAREALANFEADPTKFDAVISDLGMPGMSGLEFAKRLQAIRPDVPIVLTSGYVRAEDTANAKTLGIQDVVLKPNTVEEMATALHRVIAKHRSQI